jgi:hypothetical protein
MAFTTQNEQELAEVKAITGELDQRVQECLGQLERIRMAQSKALGRGEGGPLLAFVHIPKTAGKTVITMLAAAYSKEAVQDAGNYVRNPERTGRKLTMSSKLEARVLAGHVPYGVFREHLPADTRLMTFLREPVDRVLSHYYRHLHRRRPKKQRSPARERHRLETPGKVRTDRKAKADSIEEALVEMRLPELNNFATRFLCGYTTPSKELPASALDDAKGALCSFAFVGIQERFEESLVLLQRMLGLGRVPYEDRHVSTGDRRPAVDEIPEAQRALIEECNQLDAELYRFGLGLFEERVASAGNELEADVETLRARNASTR